MIRPTLNAIKFIEGRCAVAGAEEHSVLGEGLDGDEDGWGCFSVMDALILSRGRVQ